VCVRVCVCVCVCVCECVCSVLGGSMAKLALRMSTLAFRWDPFVTSQDEQKYPPFPILSSSPHHPDRGTESLASHLKATV
jgi:hypothetical protein